MKVLVTGGRDYEDEEVVNSALDEIHRIYGITCLIHGAATGADTLAMKWAKSRKIKHIPCPAKWRDLKAKGAYVKLDSKERPYNVNAGRSRNQEMIQKYNPKMVICFTGGSGTAHMRALAYDAAKMIMDVSEEGSITKSGQMSLF